MTPDQAEALARAYHEVVDVDPLPWDDLPEYVRVHDIERMRRAVVLFEKRVSA